MALSTLLVPVDDSPHAAARIEVAARLAAEHGSRLVGLATVNVAAFRGNVARLLPTAEVESAIARSRERAREALAGFESIVRSHDLAAFEVRSTDLGTIEALVEHARYADLVVLSQGQTDDSTDVPIGLPADVVIQSGRPALIVSRAWRNQPVGRQVAAAWDGSREAVRAFTDALPILKRAERVDVLIFNSTRRSITHGEEPGADIGLWLTRHGVPVSVTRDTVDIDIGTALLSRVADLGSDLIVMGGYGHSRLRESLFGGVTRTILESMTVPVLMSR